MRINRVSRAGLLLMELMVALLLFALAGGVCIRLTERAANVSDQARQLTRGVGEVTSAAELLRAADSREEAGELLRGAWPQTILARVAEIPMEGGTLVLEFEPVQRLTLCRITWYAGEEPVYSLELLRSWGEA